MKFKHKKDFRNSQNLMQEELKNDTIAIIKTIEIIKQKLNLIRIKNELLA